MSANFGQPNSAFGNPIRPNPAFGQSNLLGGQPTGGFGTTTTPQYGQYGNNPGTWGAQNMPQSTAGMNQQWGSSPWGQQANLNPAMGQPAPQPFVRSVSFGPSGNTSFGAQPQPQQGQQSFGTWGANTGQPAFGATSNTWSQPNWQGNPAANIWGGASFGQQPTFGGPGQVGGTGTSGFKFQPVRDSENGTSYTINHLMANQQFTQKSVEEYRLEDYKMNLSGMPKQGMQVGSLFGQSNQTASLGMTSAFGAQPTTSLFGQNQPSSFTGQHTMTPGFGAQGTIQPFQTQLSSFGANQPKPAGSLFGAQNVAPAPGMMFGQTSMGAQSSSSMFGQSQGASLFGGQQPQPGQSNPLFGGGQQNLTQNKPLFGGQPSGSIFGGQPQGGMMTGGQTQPVFGSQPQTTSLFGSQPQGGSIFGNQPQGSSLFSGGQPQTGSSFGAQPGSTFGQISTPTFGSQPQTTPLFGQPQTTPLFGQPQTTPLFGQPQTTPLFGQPQTTPLFGQPQTTSLFGQPQTQPQQFQQPQSSLFTPSQGAAPQSTASLFGGAQAASSLFSGTPQSSLFGAKPSSIFGAPPVQQSTSTLFGGPPTSTPSMFGSTSSGGLFGSTPQGTVPLSSASNLFSNPQAGSLFVNSGTSLFGQGQPQPRATPAQSAVPIEVYQSAYKDPLGLSWLMSDENVDSIMQRYQNKLSQPFNPRMSIIERISQESAQKQTSATSDKWRKNWDQVYYSPKKQNLLDITSPKRSEPIYMRKTSAYSDGGINSLSEDEGLTLGRSSSTSSLREAGHMNVTVVAYDPNPIHLIIPVTKYSFISEIKDHISKHLTTIDKNTIRLTFKGKVLNESDQLKDHAVKNMDSLTVIFEESSKKVALAPKEILPKLSSPDYKTKPDLVELARMTVDELKKIFNFTIENQHGKIEFIGETDVTGLNLDEIVKIEDKAVTVYQDESNKPAVGKGLNKPAIVHLYNCMPKKDMPFDIYEDKIKKMCERKGSQFISWSRRNFEWVFKVPHF